VKNGAKLLGKAAAILLSCRKKIMFTGLIQALGRVERVDKEDQGSQIVVTWPALDEPLVVGESVAVNGCCLTAVSLEGPQFTVQAGPETLARTTLGRTTVGDLVNLERALRMSDRFGGHFLQGHIDTTALFKERRREGVWDFLTFAIDPAWTSLMVPKGSIAVDGVSLTLVDVGSDAFSVMLIPHTLAVTTLGLIQPDDRVNIETDILAKHVQKLLASEFRKA
jgi:riboflavin synthase